MNHRNRLGCCSVYLPMHPSFGVRSGCHPFVGSKDDRQIELEICPWDMDGIKKNTDQLIELIAGRNGKDELSKYAEEWDLNTVGSHGRSPLMMASAMGDLEAVQWLLVAGADPNFTGLRGLSPLHEASANGHLKVMEFLIEAGSKINAVSEDGVTPLMCAAAWGHADAVNHLLLKGADKSIKDGLGSTASDIAQEKGEDSIAGMIVNFHSSARN